ncbi:sialic acid-binding Ig-like lectin 13 isoform X2 [Cololabis saira]|uniref:sialic acid-binding Ig-like lectin 13 isoform X2 n=1 Tax=Cololabis saira TaxID=129043 RepID=UPI002AD27558|nr:sialic acid-binding Ig-like lectin 13 isoform X2 [Cololabis saira]
MGPGKWLLVFMCICFKVTQTEASSWTARIPSSVTGLLGSCVVIPCSFNYPDPQKTHPEFTGIWVNDADGYIFHPQGSPMLQQYRGRTKLVGNIRDKNCSLKIERLQESDSGSFFFRIEIKDYNSFSYKDQKVTISVKSEPNPIQLLVKEEIKENQTAHASCSVSHCCPAAPPVFSWSRSGEETFLSQEVVDGQWSAQSILTFQLTHHDHNKPLECTVTYMGGKQQRLSKTIKVRYAPANVMVEYNPDIKEGETVGLTCSSNANPPTNSYEWHDERGKKLHQGNLYVLQNVSRHIGALYCTATNEVGSVKSSPVQLNVLYAPEFKAESLCSSKDNLVTCECVVDSKPPSTVHFVLGDKVLPSTRKQENGSFTITVPKTDRESFRFVDCWANNTQGKANLTLLFPLDEGGLETRQHPT